MKITETTTVDISSFNREFWEDKKNKLKEKFPYLTDSDLKYEDGKVEQMIEKLHAKIGNAIISTKEGLHKLINEL
jgi:uncharacterized protein YjbJ (UPF0337 family)